MGGGRKLAAFVWAPGQRHANDAWLCSKHALVTRANRVHLDARQKGTAMNLFFLVSRARNDVLDSSKATKANSLDSRFMREQRRIYADVYGR